MTDSTRQQYHRVLLPLSGMVIAAVLALSRVHADLTVLEAEPAQSAPSVSAPTVTIYDPNPQHLWNRLYGALYVRTTPDGKTYGEDELDPILWPSTKYLLTAPRHGQVLSLLDEFLQNDGQDLIGDPLKRVLFQRDLWGIFDWLADPHPEHQRHTGHLIAERRALRNRLAQMIHRVALSREQIQALPDNHAMAVATRTFAVEHDPAQPQQAFLPVDLLESNGAWVLLEERGGSPAAPLHVGFAAGRSAFFVLMKLPGGRHATCDYLRVFPHGLAQLPAATQFALVRQMMAIDDERNVVPTRLVEEVQIRVFRDIASSNQDFYWFRLRRKDLFAGKAGGLHAVNAAERVFSLFSVQDGDVFETRPDDLERGERERDAARKQPAPITENLQFGCFSCHNQGPGIESVLSFRRNPTPQLVESNREDEAQAAIRWKQRHYSWGLFQGLTEDRPVR